MPKFTVTMFEVGDRVVVTSGEHAGRRGVVRGTSRIASSVPDPSHVVQLDEPIVTPAQDIAVPGYAPIHVLEGRIDRVEVPASALDVA